jgi:transcriptional regulator GlxA family with amidase domain
MDLALALVQEDLGLKISRATAQEMVLYHRRPGGQSQFSTLTQMAPESSRMQQVLGYIREHLHLPLSTEELADCAHLSVRQFGRIFRCETLETPAKAVERIRAEVAYTLIEETDEPIETVAKNVGFIDPERMRRAFLRIYAQPPQGIRRNVRSAREQASMLQSS